MQHKTVPLTSVIGIVVALISMKVLRSVTEWNQIVVVLASVVIAFAVTAAIVFLYGAFGPSQGTSGGREERPTS